MNLNSPKLRKLQLAAFRGVPMPLRESLDFSSPLTIIYAPNGTAKTSIIDAVEWLYTGTVHRLGKHSEGRSKKATPQQLRCLSDLASNIQTEVSGDVCLGNEEITLIRRLNENKPIINSGSTKRISEAALLKILAPEGAGENASGRSELTQRRNWLRSARFLTEDTLSILVDSDKKNEKERNEVLAELLGVQELKDEAKKFETYARVIQEGHISPGRVKVPGIGHWKGELQEKESKLEVLRRQLEQMQADDSQIADNIVTDKLEGVLAQLRELGLSQFDQDVIVEDPQGAIAVFAAKVGEEEQKASEKRVALHAVTLHWDDIGETEAALAQHRKQQKEKKKLALKLENKTAKPKDEISRGLALQDSSAAQTEKLLEARSELRRVCNELSASTKECYNLNVGFSEDMTIHQIESFAEALLSDSTTFDLIETLKELEEEAGSFFNSTSLLEEHRKELLEIEKNLPVSDVVEKMKAEVPHLEERFKKSQTRFNDASGPLEPLRLAVRRFMESNQNDTECPACGHNWTKPEALKKALEKSSKSVPSRIHELEEQVLTSEQIFKTEQSKLIQIEEGEAEKRKLASQIESRESEVNQYKVKLTNLLTDCGVECSPSKFLDLSTSLNQLRNKLSVFEALSEFKQAWKTASGYFPDELLLDVPVQNLWSKLGKTFDDKEIHLRAESEERRQTIDKNKEQLKNIQNQMKDAEESIKTLSSKIASASKVVEEFSGAWQALDGPSARSVSSLAMLQNQISETESTLTLAKRDINAAKEALSSIEIQQNVSKLESEIEELVQKVKAADKRRAKAVAAANALREYADQHTSRQIRLLLKVVEPIFWRLQANEVYDRIKGGNEESPLNWKGEFMGKDFDISQYFSRGQRQDFALALFLARARQLGGTFFMDEPIVHLDDLNRVALLDTFRVIATENDNRTNMVVTTASKPLLRHLKEKFANVRSNSGAPPLKIYLLSGGPRVGVSVEKSEEVGF